MAKYTGENIFEKIGSFIPGYKGYSEKEGRRDTDKLLRLEIAKHLDSMKTNINDLIRQHTEAKQLEFITELDRIKINLDSLANQIRYASHGEAGFFDIVQVDAKDLDRLYQFDLKIKEETEQLVNMINALFDTQHLKKNCFLIINALSTIGDKISNRDKVIMEVR